MKKWFFAVWLGIAPLCGYGATDDSAASQLPDWTYVVQPGDTIIGVSVRYVKHPQQNWTAIQRLNRVANPQAIPPGTRLRIPAKLLRQTAGKVTLQSVTGAVAYRVGVQAAWQAGHQGDVLPAGAEIKTGHDGFAMLVLANGSAVHLQADTVLQLDRLAEYAGGAMADTRLQLQNGRVHIEDNPQHRSDQYLRVITPTAQAVVRGTDFRAAASDGDAQDETLDGRVDLSAGGQRVVVAKGMGTVAHGNQPPGKAVQLLPAPDLSQIPGQFEQLPLHITLPVLDHAQALYAELYAAERPDTELMGKQIDNGVWAIADLPNGNYVLHVRGVDGQGLQGYDAKHDFTVFARPFPPIKTHPAPDQVVRTARPAFTWSAVLNVGASHIQVARDADFKQLLVDQQTQSTTWTPVHDLPEGLLFWRVSSIDQQPGPWGQATKFVYKAAPDAPDLSKNVLQFKGNILFGALPAPQDGNIYRISLARDPDMKQPIVTNLNSASGQFSIAYPGSGTYYLGVAQIDTSDGTAGPLAIQKLEAPRPYGLLWVLTPLIPFL